MSLAKLNDVSVGKKLGASFALLIILTAVIAVIAITTLNDYNQRSLIVAGASAAESYLLDARTEEKNFELRGDDSYLEHAKELADQAVDRLLPLKDVLASAENDARIYYIAENVNTYKSQLDELARKLESGIAG